MKKFILFASVLAGLFAAASCQQEKLEPEMNGGVTYEISLPTAPQTKGEGGYDNYDLHYEVYKTADASALKTAPLLFEKTVQMTGDKTKVTLDLLNDQDYTILFWANKQGEYYFDLTDLRKVGVKQAASNNDDRDAFCGMDQLSKHDGAQSKTVELKRPFAQINIATLVPTVAEIGYDVTPLSSRVKVKNIPVKYNVFTGDPVGDEVEVEYTVNLIPEGNLTVNSTDYRKVAMNYAIVPATDDNSATVEVYYEINTVNGTVKNSIPNVPVKKNYRTNIIGNLLTSNATYNIQILPGFEGDNGAHVEVINEGITKNINGDYEITNAKGLAYAVNNLFVDANGVANTATFYVKPGIYDMAQHAIKDITVTSGTLKVYDTEAVVTRSATTSSVVIKGLKKALISRVEDGATVFFSGITVTDFNGADNAAALVQKNEGKVVLADCNIVNEEGENTALVGGKAPVKVEKGEEEAGDLIYTAEQLAAAFADETVEPVVLVLGADIALENTLTFPAGRTATLDLRGWELTVNEPASNYVINNHGTLTIEDKYTTGEVNARGIYNGYVKGGDPISTAKLTIKGGNFNAMGTNGGAAVYNYAKVQIDGGNFQSNGGYGLNNQVGGVMTVNSADVRGGIYNCGTLTVTESKVYQHLSDKHCIYNSQGSVTIKSGEFDSESGNELIFADGQNASVVIEGGEFHKTAKSWLYAAATGKDITFTITGGTHYGYVNEPEMTVDTFRPYGDPIVVTGGSYNFDVTKWCAKDYKAVKNAETAMWDVVEKVYVAKIGEDGYESLKEAVAAVQDDETITLVANETFTEANRTHNTGTWYDGLYYIGDKNFTIDLDGKTISQNGAVNDYLLNFKNEGAKANTITLKNGTIDAGTAAFCAICTSSIQENELTINTENINIINNMSNGSTIKLRGGAILNVNEGTKITGKNSYLGIESVASTVNIYDGAEIYMNGTSSYNGCLVGACAGGTVNVHGGYGKGVKGGFIAMTSGGTINVSGGEWIANTDGSIGDNSNLYVLTAQSNKNESGFVSGAFINVTGGTFRGGMDAWVLNNAPEEVAELNISGGNFNANPNNYLVDGYIANADENGIFSVTKFVPAAKVGNTEYGSIDEAIAAWTNNTTLTLLSDVTLSDVVTLKSTEHHILNLATYTMTAASGKNAIEIQACGNGSAERTSITINASTTNPGGINAGSESIIYYKYADGGITIEDRPIIKINGGVFTGSTNSLFGNAGIHTIGSEARKCATLNITGGTFNCTIAGNTKSKLLISGGLFNYSVKSQGDGTALRLISGGTFKSFGFMTADSNNTKFWIGTAMAKSDVGVYVNKDGYLVVGGPVITEAPGANYEKKSYSSWSSYLQYSSAATYGLYYEK